MTDLLQRLLRSAMSGKTGNGSVDGGSVGDRCADMERWSHIEAIAQRRKDRSDLGQRTAMICSVFLVAGSALALGSGSIFGSTEAGSAPGTDGEMSPSSAHTVWRWLLVLGLTVLVGNGIAALWRRIPGWYRALESSPSGRWGRILGTIIILGGLTLPTWAFTNFALKYDDFTDRMQSLDEELDTISFHSPTIPMFGSYQPTVRLEVVPSEPDGDPLTQVRTILIQRGFKVRPSDPSILSRRNGSSDQGWIGRDDLTLSATSQGLVLIEARTSAGSSGRDWLPLATVVGFTLVALGAVLAWYGTSVGSWFGVLLLTVSAGQTGLALRALFKVRALFDQFDQAIDSTRSDPDFDAFRRQVEDAGGDLYPLGSASLVFLLLPWIVGCILVFKSKSQLRAWSISLGLAVTVATYVTFQSMDSDFMTLID